MTNAGKLLTSQEHEENQFPAESTKARGIYRERLETE